MKYIFIGVLLCIRFYSLATSIYVDQEHIGTSNGTITQPYKTISEALNAASNDDIIYVAGGIYRETLTPTKNGISIEALSEDVYITGTDIISEWTNIGQGIYKSYVPKPCTEIFVNSVKQMKARYPNTASGTDVFEFNTTAVNLDIANNKATLTNINPVDSTWAGGTVWMLVYPRWVSVTAKIESVENNELNINYASTENFSGSGIAYITNTLAALDTIGEWHWQNDSLYYFLGEAANIEELTIEAQTRSTLINMSNRSDITVSGIKGYSGNVLMDKSNSCVLQQCKFEYLNNYHYIDKESTEWYSSYSRLEWTNISSHGIGIGVFGSNNLIDDCEVSLASGDCITLFGSDNTVSNCVIHDANILGADMAPIALGGTGNEIIHNEIYNGGRSLITMLSASEFKISYNNMYTTGLITWDQGGIYTYDTDGKNSEISYNWVHDIRSLNPELNWGGPAIYLDNNSSNYTVHHNVVWDCKGQGIQLNGPAINIDVYNNTGYNCGDMLTYHHPNFTSISSSNCTFTNNYIDGDLLIQPWLNNQNNISSSDNHLSDRENLNFTPIEESVLIDAGIITDEQISYYGTAPDIGAYEYQGIHWTAGPFSTEDVVLSTDSQNTDFDTVFPTPNPVENAIQLTNSDHKSYEIYAISGLLIKAGAIKSNTINMNDVPAGIYTMKLKGSKTASTKSLRVVKQ